MITLITGAPGSGKSAALVQLLAELVKGRAIYVDGVPDLKLPHFDLDGSKWHETVPDGAAVVIDEVQRVWRPRGPSQKVPPDIAALETHRHRGIDFYIVTQAPRLLDTNVRALIGRHVHLRDLGFIGRWWYEWPECSEGLAWKTAPIKKKYRLPKAAFSLYKSASIHVKPVRSFPMMLVVMVCSLIAVGLLTFKAYGAISGKFEPKHAAASGASPGARADISSVAAPRSNLGSAPVMTSADLAVAFSPRIQSMPESAPIYDQLRQVKALPFVVGCMVLRERCACYTEQGTDAGLSGDECRAWLRNPPFNPWRERAEPMQRAAIAAEDRPVSGTP